jgi:hypothetical protein
MALRVIQNATGKTPYVNDVRARAAGRLAHGSGVLFQAASMRGQGSDAFNGSQRIRNRFQQRIAGKWLEQNGDGFRAVHQLARGFVEAAGDHDHRQPASGRGQGFAELHAIHLGKIYIDYQACVGFRKLAVEDRARPIKGHNFKSGGQHKPAQRAKNR